MTCLKKFSLLKSLVQIVAELYLNDVVVVNNNDGSLKQESISFDVKLINLINNQFNLNAIVLKSHTTAPLDTRSEFPTEPEHCLTSSVFTNNLLPITLNNV